MNVTNPPVPTMYTVCEAMKECGVNDTDLFEGKIQAERWQMTYLEMIFRRVCINIF